MLELYMSFNIIELYVEEDSMIHQLPKCHEEFSRMIDLNKSTGFMSSVQHVPPVD